MPGTLYTLNNVDHETASLFAGFPASERRAHSDETQIPQLIDVFMSSPPGQFIHELERLNLDELPFPVFYRDLVKPVACVLGDMWSEDTAGFLGVSVAIERLRLAIDILYPDDDFQLRANPKRVLIHRFENSRHDFGAFLLGKAFFHSNWLVERFEGSRTVTSPVVALSESRFDVFALSVGAPFDIDAVAAMIKKARVKTANPSIVIALGGVGPALDPDAFATCGADFISKDVFEAVSKANAAVLAAV